MGKFTGLMICSDIDSTLTNDNNDVSEENINAIKYFTENGGIFTLATGRIPLTIPKVLYEFIKVPVICQNGSAIFDVHKKEYISYKQIDSRAREIANEIASKFDFVGIELYRLFDIGFLKENFATKRHSEVEKIPCVTHLDCSIFEAEGPVIKILFAQEDEETDILDNEYKNSPYQNEYKLVKSHKWYYEILRKDISKGTALKELCGYLNFDLKNVIAVGDNDNDIDMLKVSGLGVAVENATENLKKVADRITKNNNQHALADIIFKL